MPVAVWHFCRHWQLRGTYKYTTQCCLTQYCQLSPLGCWGVVTSAAVTCHQTQRKSQAETKVWPLTPQLYVTLLSSMTDTWQRIEPLWHKLPPTAHQTHPQTHTYTHARNCNSTSHACAKISAQMSRARSRGRVGEDDVSHTRTLCRKEALHHTWWVVVSLWPVCNIVFIVWICCCTHNGK